MLILLEGADGAGKTTIVDELARLTQGAYVLHQGPPDPSTPIRDVYERPFFGGAELGTLDRYEPGTCLPIVCDRWHLGELVYGPMLRGESRLNALQRWHLERVLTSLGGVLALVHVDEQVRRNRLATRGDDLVTADQAVLAGQMYQSVATRTAMPTTHLDGAKLANTNARSILSLARQQTTLAAKLWSFHQGRYIGSLEPELVLVGTDNLSDHDLPAPFPPYDWPTGAYLCEVTRYLPPHGTVTLGKDVDIRGLLASFGRQQPRIVALGTEAGRLLDNERIRHGTVPHPRLRPDDRSAYTQLIRSAAVQQKDLIARA